MLYCKVFIRPIRAANVLSKQELSILFINWKDLIITNTKLMKSMRIRRGTVQSQSMIGDILCENVRPCHPKLSQLSVKIIIAVPSHDCLHSFLFLPALGSSSSSKAGTENDFFRVIYLSLCSLVRWRRGMSLIFFSDNARLTRECRACPCPSTSLNQ